MRALPERMPNITKENVQAIRRLIDKTIPDCLVQSYRPLIAGLELPDPNDRHVLAAAIRCGAQVIVTCDKSHFPVEELSPYDIEAQHPDTFIIYQKEENTLAVLAQLKAARLTYNQPQLSVEEFIARFRNDEMVLTGAWLESAGSLL